MGGRLLLASLLTLCASAQDAAETWTRFRGPNGSGVAELPAGATLPDRLDPEANLLWRCALPPGHSSPILSADAVYVTALAEDALVTLCVDRASGEVRWRRPCPRPRVEALDGRNHPASPSPVVGDGFVVVFFPEFGLQCFGADGVERWRRPLEPFTNVYGMGASPILHEGVVYLACDQAVGSYLLAVSAASGETLWRKERRRAKSGHCTPVIRPGARWRRQVTDALGETRGSGPDELLLPGSFFLDAYDAESGEVRWSAPGLCFEMKSVPVLHDDLVIVNGYGSPMNQPGNQIEVGTFESVLAERDADADGRIAREEMPATRAAAFFDFVDLARDGWLDAADWAYLRAALASQNGLLALRCEDVAAEDDRVVAGRGSLAWAERRGVPQLPSPLVVGDLLYVLGDQGGLLSTYRPATGELLERGRVEGANDAFYASPVAGDGKVFLVSEHGLAFVLPADGGCEPLSATELGGKVHGTPALSAGRVFVRTDTALLCFGDPSPAR